MMGLVRGFLAAGTMIAFIALVLRVWNRKYQAEFDQVARLALDDDQAAPSAQPKDQP
jgi:cbb3-type cytochrome oxidase subunit 3